MDNSNKIAIQTNKVEKAAAILKVGGLVALPTETVYGLAANALDEQAVAKIYEAKGRPSFNPLIVHVSNIESAQKYTTFNEAAQKLAEVFWPGPLTLVLPRKDDCPLSLLVSAGLNTIALRAPNHPLAQAVLTTSGLPLAAPSANKSGSISPTTADHVKAGLGAQVDMILDGGPATVGLESTIVGVLNDKLVLLRPGSISPEDLADIAGLPIEKHSGDDITAPGQMASHYAPNTPIRLNAFRPDEGEVFIGFSGLSGNGEGDMNLSEAGNLTEAAANLFAMLHQADQQGASGIAVAPIPYEGLGWAINDRLERAAAPKDEN
jgi:L-threonylcarbamoyladenylate synthase